jgi:hypothetical protein
LKLDEPDKPAVVLKLATLIRIFAVLDETKVENESFSIIPYFFL